MKVDYDMFAKSLADSYTNKRSEILREKENSENLTRQIEVMEAEVSAQTTFIPSFWY